MPWIYRFERRQLLAVVLLILAVLAAAATVTGLSFLLPLDLTPSGLAGWMWLPLGWMW